MTPPQPPLPEFKGKGKPVYLQGSTSSVVPNDEPSIPALALPPAPLVFGEAFEDRQHKGDGDLPCQLRAQDVHQDYRHERVSSGPPASGDGEQRKRDGAATGYGCYFFIPQTRSLLLDRVLMQTGWEERDSLGARGTPRPRRVT